MTILCGKYETYDHDQKLKPAWCGETLFLYLRLQNSKNLRRKNWVVEMRWFTSASFRSTEGESRLFGNSCQYKHTTTKARSRFLEIILQEVKNCVDRATSKSWVRQNCQKRSRFILLSWFLVIWGGLRGCSIMQTPFSNKVIEFRSLDTMERWEKYLLKKRSISSIDNDI